MAVIGNGLIHLLLNTHGLEILNNKRTVKWKLFY